MIPDLLLLQNSNTYYNFFRESAAVNNAPHEYQQQRAVLQSCEWIKCLPEYTSAIPSSFQNATGMSHVKWLTWDVSHLKCKEGCSPFNSRVFITINSQWWACKKVCVSLPSVCSTTPANLLFDFASIYVHNWVVRSDLHVDF